MKNYRLAAYISLSFVILTAGLSGCSKGDEELKLPVINPAPLKSTNLEETKAEAPKYVYPYSAERDPFVALAGDGIVPAASVAGPGAGFLNKKGEFLSLELKGIMSGRGGKMAMITSSNGQTYFLRSGKIYDRDNQVVSGITGVIRDESIVLISENRVKKELFINQNTQDKTLANPAQGQPAPAAALPGGGH